MKNKDSKRGLVAIDAAVAGPLFMLSAALLFTLLNVLVKLLGPQYRVWDIGFYRSFGGVLLLFAVFKGRQHLFRGHNIPLLIIRGCTGSVAFISMVTAIRLLPISTAMVIFYAFPAFSAVFSFLIYGERIRKSEIACIITVLMGIAVLFDFEPGQSLLGQMMALLGSIFAGLTVTLIRSLRQQNGPVVIYLYFCMLGTLVTLPKFLDQPVFPATSSEWVMIAGIIFFSATAQLLMNQGFFYCRGWEGGVFMSSEVAFTAIVGIVFLKDPCGWRFWIGGALILSSVIALNRLKASANHVVYKKSTT